MKQEHLHYFWAVLYIHTFTHSSTSRDKISVVEAAISRVDFAVEATFVLGHLPELFLIHNGFCFDSDPYCLEVFLRPNPKQCLFVSVVRRCSAEYNAPAILVAVYTYAIESSYA